MNTSLKTVLALSFAGLLAACGNNQQQEDSHEGHNHGSVTTVEAPAAAKAAVVIKDDNLNAVYQQYQKLTEALTEGNTTTAKVAAVAFEAGAKEIKGGSNLAATAAQITNAANLDAQRTIFASLNDEFIALLKQTGMNSGKLFVAHCPMALNDKGASWVSNTKEIRNPYYGESMLTCGSVKETLK
ncbi:DUF3347 domain-containing protein [Pedobacter immunditicola]|uniref:DUF3347 domain-containing protein n=1 Tax=Pedobacter immunditicola TaxID=3133440 RepID=UPI0030A3E18C